MNDLSWLQPFVVILLMKNCFRWRPRNKVMAYRIRRWFGLLLVVIILLIVLRSLYTGHSSQGSPDNTDTDADDKHHSTLLIFTGRWKFLRVGLPYIYRDLTINGGVLDNVVFLMAQYDNETYNKLKSFNTAANELLKEEVFKMRDLPGFKPGQSPTQWQKHVYRSYDQIIREVRENPKIQYLKADDDVVYYHPGTFREMFTKNNSPQCFLHYGNIGGSNWRCTITHQRMGLFNNTEFNSKKLRFDDDPYAKCGWRSPQCAEVTIRAFLHYYKNRQLDRYLFKGLELLSDRRRFSINLFLINKNVIREELQKVLPVNPDDELWWSKTYPGMIKEPNCIVGEALIVHFSYHTTYHKMIQLGFLDEFARIARQEVGPKIPQALWKLLDY